MTIGSKIKELRLARGLTQKGLGNLCGMADSAIRRYESDRGNPTEKTLNKIASALGVYTIELLPDDQLSRISPEHQLADYFDIINDSKKLLQEQGLNLVIDDAFNCTVVPQDKLKHIIQSFHLLNEEGKSIAVERVEELTQIPRYQRIESPLQQIESKVETDHTESIKPPEGQSSPPDGK